MRRRLLATCVAGMLSLAMNTTRSYAGSGVDWERAVYWDERYPTCWTDGTAMRDGLEYAGYSILDADQLKIWMEARISDGADSVVVFCQDIAPDTVVEVMSSHCTLREYLNAGGKVVWYADIPLYYQGRRDGGELKVSGTFSTHTRVPPYRNRAYRYLLSLLRSSLIPASLRLCARQA